MLGAGRHFQVAGVISLQSFNHGDAHFRSQVRVFTVGFVSASPPGIPEDVYVRCPECQSGVPLEGISFLYGSVVDGPAFIGNHSGRLEQLFRIECGRQSDGLGKYGHLFRGAGHSVQAFIPPVVVGYAEARYAFGGMSHLGNLFLQRHARHQIVDTHVQRQSGVEVGQCVLCM